MESLEKRRILLYGLSANPPVKVGGHAEIVRHFSLEYHEVWVMPVYAHIYDSKRNLAPFDLRLKMCKICFVEDSSINSRGNVKVIEVEKDLILREIEAAKAQDGSQETSSETTIVRIGTIDVVRHLLTLQQVPAEFTLLLGGDTYADLRRGKWKNGKELLDLVRIVVVSRVGVELPEDLRETSSQRLLPIDPLRVEVVRLDTLTDISSTKARNTIDENFLRSILTQGVLELIKENKLYSFSAGEIFKQ